MIQFFDAGQGKIYAVGTENKISENDLPKLQWLFGNAALIDETSLTGFHRPREKR